MDARIELAQHGVRFTNVIAAVTGYTLVLWARSFRTDCIDNFLATLSERLLTSLGRARTAQFFAKSAEHVISASR